MRFRTWLNEGMQSEHDQELQRIWADTFKALGLAGLADEDAAQQSLSKITFNQRNSKSSSENMFKGKQAVRKRLENGQIIARLQKIGDPEIRKNVEAVRNGEHSSNASTTVSNLLQMMFGQETFQKFIDSDFPKVDTAKAQVEPQPPKQDMGQESPSPDNSMDQNSPQPPMPQMQPGQPQVPPNAMQPNPTNPMPPKPAGAEFGMF